VRVTPKRQAESRFGAENARSENDGPRKLQGLKMQDPKMTNKSYCKIQDLQMTDLNISKLANKATVILRNELTYSCIAEYSSLANVNESIVRFAAGQNNIVVLFCSRSVVHGCDVMVSKRKIWYLELEGNKEMLLKDRGDGPP